MPQYKVPQNIDLEDKIVGPFTMKQFVYLMVGGGLIYGLYQGWIDYENGVLYTILAGIPIAALALALTFIKVNDRPFEFFLVNLLSYLTKPKKRLWQQGYEPSKVVFVTPKADQPLPATNANARHATLEEIASHLEAQSANTGSVLPAGQAKDSGPGTQVSGAEKPETRDQRPKTQPPDARFTVDDLQKGRETTIEQGQSAKLQAPKLGTWVQKNPEPVTQGPNPPPANQPPTIVASAKGIFSRFGKKTAATPPLTSNGQRPTSNDPAAAAQYSHF
jgi:hypothetical protein